MLRTSKVLDQRRIQFQQRLVVMKRRALEVASGSCYLRFEQWDPVSLKVRFVQYSFEEHCFHLDLPQQTLSRDEAARIMAWNRGFFYLSQAPEYTLYEEDVDGADPFRTVYFCGDEGTAAEDTASILYSIWGLELGAPIFVTAGSFNEKHHWESGLPLLAAQLQA